MFKSIPLILDASEIQYFHSLCHCGQQRKYPQHSSQLLVFAGVGGELGVIVQPLELQRPAPLGQAGEDKAVPLQVNLRQARLRFKVWHNII